MKSTLCRDRMTPHQPITEPGEHANRPDMAPRYTERKFPRVGSPEDRDAMMVTGTNLLQYNRNSKFPHRKRQQPCAE
ncbi:hypothetical protein [Varunaivibrio sulfuroxidans]|uniref:Uncharacterized protein n=1 Tax=Varunaivibrio sulfuroxidans TaxID=1773489 RepID=A0A4R3JAV6_9PROT|nr:hypothetical protein [Varunaivibrio sulfuroxidans]TCS63139.1 hypothetical protein EDD55_104232 [Varunaivibrio sulfuroxidans]WES31794.1 hypothetical protein P3M64_05405 [Varunaivibrio sulfuroxidans]